jgi:hypothetical protein
MEGTYPRRVLAGGLALAPGGPGAMVTRAGTAATGAAIPAAEPRLGPGDRAVQPAAEPFAKRPGEGSLAPLLFLTTGGRRGSVCGPPRGST